MKRSARWSVAILAILMFLFTGWRALHWYVLALHAGHGECCTILPAIQNSISPMISQGVIDPSKAAEYLQIPRWTSDRRLLLADPNTRSIQTRQQYDDHIWWELSRTLGRDAKREWEDAVRNHGKSEGQTAVACFLATLTLAYVMWATRAPRENSFPS